ncbi:hypothetical protein LZ554_007858 [Drepanopeziza brunnea f. sp. 'monogermtubi']|nr:hypothetical protein LZ554_007858 [Drepanopeziza brunnea f. sp. 'monogermtubi']
MSVEKGKGRAKPEEDDANSTQDAPSLLSRIAASATGLTRNASMAPASATELQNAASNSEKGRSLPGVSSSGRAWAESSKSTSSHQQTNSQASSSSGLRTTHSEQHVQASEQEFSSFLDGIPSFVPSESFGTIPVADSRSSFDEAWSRSQAQLADSSSSTVAEQESRDGEDVVALLSKPSAIDTPPGIEEDENYDWGLTPAQISQLRERTRDLLPAPEQHGNISENNALNLLPDFQGQEEAREQYLNDWSDVLNRYADEVWGGLLPLVKEARREVEELRTDEHGIEESKTKAIRRLNAILGHLG